MLTAASLGVLLWSVWCMRERRYPLTLLLSSATAYALWHWYPFPDLLDNPLLEVIAGSRPLVYGVLKSTWGAVLFFLPAYAWYGIVNRAQRLRIVEPRVADSGPLPLYPDPELRRELYAVVGELHHADVLQPHPNPRWCEIPEAGLSRGVMVLGSIGTGKTSSLLLPIADQVFAYAAHDRSQRVGGLVLEVKTDFCRQVRGILETHHRGGDYMEIGPQSPYCYNPLHGDTSAATMAFRLMSVLRTIQGTAGEKTGKENFWEQAAEGFITFLILVHRLLYGYVTLRDLYVASSNLDVVDQMMKQAAAALEHDYILIAKADYLKLPGKASKQLDLFCVVDGDGEGDKLRLECSAELIALLDKHQVVFERVQPSNDPAKERRRTVLESAKIYYKKMKVLSLEMRANVAETVNVNLAAFDMDAEARRIFCPPAAAYDPVLNRDGKYGRPLPTFAELIESPTVLALALPAATDEKVARIAGVLLKLDWQRAVLLRKSTPGWDARRSRRLLMLIDEYHLLATAGGSAPDGDEKFLNLCRDVGCIPVVATQSLSSLRATVGSNEPVITQALQTTICLRQKDAATAEWMSKMTGRKDILREHWGVSEGQVDVVPSLMGGLVAPSGSMNMSRGWNEQRDSIFEPKFMHELPDACGVICLYDGFNQHPPSLIYLQQYGQDHRVSWFKANAHRRKAAAG